MTASLVARFLLYLHCAFKQNHLGTYDFRNGKPGLYPLKGTAAVAGTALDDAIFGNILLPDNHSPRAVDLLPIFYTGVPNLISLSIGYGKTRQSACSRQTFYQ